MNAKELIGQMLGRMAEGRLFKFSGYAADESIRRDFADELEEAAKELPNGCRFVRMDVSAYTTVDDFIRALALKMLEDPALKPTDTIAKPANFGETVSMRDIQKIWFPAMLKGFEKAGIRYLIVLENFDAALSYWQESDLAWLRERLDGSKVLACVLLATVYIKELTELPSVGSPLWNIFLWQSEITREG